MAKSKKESVSSLLTVPTYTKQPTKNPDVFRLVDRSGEWTHYWIKSLNKIVPGITYVLGVGYPKGEGFMKYLLNTTKEESEKRLKVAGEEGSRSHEAVTMLITGSKIDFKTKFMNRLNNRQETLNDDEWWHLESWVTWCKKYQFNYISIEESLFVRDSEVAGTYDALGTILIPDGDKSFPKEVWGKRILVLIDWKFSSGVWESYKAQASCYRKGLLESGKLAPYLEKYGELWTAIVRCGTKHKEGFEVKAWDGKQSDENYEKYFKSALVFFEEQESGFPENRDIPIEFMVNVPLEKISKQVIKKPKNKSKKNKKLKTK